MGSERGQATVEWVALVLCVALALGAVVAFVPLVDGRSLGGTLAHAILCAVRGGCRARDGDAALAAAYGSGDAELVRRYAPNIVYEPGTYTLPVDWRRCRSHLCSDAPDRADLDVHRSARSGAPATAFTHVVRRGGETFLQYWFYYPDSTTTWGHAAGVWSALDLVGRPSYPGFHYDDWEGYQVRVDARGRALSRATSHFGYQWCKESECENRWGPWTGWTRVSRGSHAGHIPTVRRGIPSVLWHEPGRWLGGRAAVRPAVQGIDAHERMTTASGLRLVPLEAIDRRSYRSLRRGGPVPPWRKRVYTNPVSNSTG